MGSKHLYCLTCLVHYWMSIPKPVLSRGSRDCINSSYTVNTVHTHCSPCMHLRLHVKRTWQVNHSAWYLRDLRFCVVYNNICRHYSCSAAWFSTFVYPLMAPISYYVALKHLDKSTCLDWYLYRYWYLHLYSVIHFNSPVGRLHIHTDIYFNNTPTDVTQNKKRNAWLLERDVLTSSEVATVLESSSAPSWTRPTSPVELAFAPSAAGAAFLGCALVSLLLRRQGTLALLFVLLQELASILFLQLHVGDLWEAVAHFGQRVYTCSGEAARVQLGPHQHLKSQRKMKAVYEQVLFFSS